jgi:hypothetical protein
LDLAGPETAGTNQDALGLPVDDGPDALQVRHLAPLVDTGDIQTDTARLFRLTTTGDLAGLDGSLRTNVANLSHGNNSSSELTWKSLECFENLVRRTMDARFGDETVSQERAL